MHKTTEMTFMRGLLLRKELQHHKDKLPPTVAAKVDEPLVDPQDLVDLLHRAGMEKPLHRDLLPIVPRHEISLPLRD